MGCNCKATEKILNIHKRYGTPAQLSAVEKINFYIKEIPKLLSIVILMFLLSPILIIFFIVIIIQEKGVIDINKLIKKFTRHK
jgi:hypothetical protein